MRTWGTGEWGAWGRRISGCLLLGAWVLRVDLRYALSPSMLNLIKKKDLL